MMDGWMASYHKSLFTEKKCSQTTLRNIQTESESRPVIRAKEVWTAAFWCTCSPQGEYIQIRLPFCRLCRGLCLPLGTPPHPHLSIFIYFFKILNHFSVISWQQAVLVVVFIIHGDFHPKHIEETNM